MSFFKLLSNIGETNNEGPNNNTGRLGVQAMGIECMDNQPDNVK